jgi:hypothetical protein
VLLHKSVANQVRVSVCWQLLPLVTVARTTTRTFVPLHASEAVGGSKSHTDPHSTVLLEAQVMTGGVVSTSVTVWLQVLLLPKESVASQV